MLKRPASNRTSVELKHLSEAQVKQIENLSSNRTSVELKPDVAASEDLPEYQLLIEPVWN